MRWLGEQFGRVDALLARVSGRRRVLVDAPTATSFATLAPVFQRLLRDRRVELLFAARRPADVLAAARAAGVRSRVHARSAMLWRRIDVVLAADLRDPIALHRCRRRIGFFHGAAGACDLESAGDREAAFGAYDRVAFIDAGRMHRYVELGLVSRQAAVLVGYPKVDALANGRYDAADVHGKLQLEMHRRTAMYAPSWSPASSLHLAGEAIVESLVAAGFNVVVKLHDRSLDASEAALGGGVDWRARFARIHVPGRIAFVETADASPLLAASDVVVTDHSSIGFEFLLLDRPLLVFDAPDLTRAAQLDPAAVARLRSAARVVRDAGAVGAAAADEIDHPERLSDVRRAVARDTFYEPGTATERALAVVYEMLDLPAAAASAGMRAPAHRAA